MACLAVADPSGHMEHHENEIGVRNAFKVDVRGIFESSVVDGQEHENVAQDSDRCQVRENIYCHETNPPSGIIVRDTGKKRGSAQGGTTQTGAEAEKAKGTPRAALFRMPMVAAFLTHHRGSIGVDIVPLLEIASSWRLPRAMDAGRLFFYLNKLHVKLCFLV